MAGSALYVLFKGQVKKCTIWMFNCERECKSIAKRVADSCGSENKLRICQDTHRWDPSLSHRHQILHKYVSPISILAQVEARSPDWSPATADTSSSVCRVCVYFLYTILFQSRLKTYWKKLCYRIASIFHRTQAIFYVAVILNKHRFPPKYKETQSTSLRKHAAAKMHMAITSLESQRHCLPLK